MSNAPTMDQTGVTSPDVGRATPLIRACGLRFARTHGEWLEDGYVAVKVDAPFSELLLGITIQPDPLPPFVVDARSAGTGMLRKWDRLMVALGKGLRSDADPEPATVELRGWPAWDLDADRTGRPFVLPDGRRFKVQERYYQGAVTVARPDRWEAVFKPIPKRQQSRFGTHWNIPIMVGWRGDEMAAIIQSILRRSVDGVMHDAFPSVAAAGAAVGGGA